MKVAECVAHDYISTGDGRMKCRLCGRYSPHAPGRAASEKELQAAIVEWLKLNGWFVTVTSRTAKTEGGDEGMPDLYAMRRGVSMWLEVKRPLTGDSKRDSSVKLRPSQVRWLRQAVQQTGNRLRVAVVDSLDAVQAVADNPYVDEPLQETPVWPKWAIKAVLG